MARTVSKRRSFTAECLLVAAAAAAGCALAAARALASFVDVLYVSRRHRVAVERHYRVGQAIALIGFYPWLDAAAGKAVKRKQHEQ
jgi:hypothetical protein